MMGRFITVEGADGVGKTTQLDFIEKWLGQQRLDVLRTREPGGTALGEMLRQILLNSNDVLIDHETELLMMFAARKQHLAEVIRPALEAGRWVLSDRFTDATYAYQGAGRGIPDSRIEPLERWVQGNLQPDLTLLFDVDVEVGISRSEARDLAQDRFEVQLLPFKYAVRKGYLERAARFPDRIKVVDAANSIDQVQRNLSQLLTAFIAQQRSSAPTVDSR